MLATLVSVVIGVVVAFLLALTDIRGKAALDVCRAAAAAGAIADHRARLDRAHRRVARCSRRSGLAPAPGDDQSALFQGGIVLVMGIEHSTLVFLAVRAGLRNLPRDLIEAARLGGAHPLRVTRSVILPLALPAILAGAALAFVASIGNFGIPALLGIPGRYTMLTTLIYQRLQGFGPRVLGEVAALAVVLAALGGGGLLLRAAGRGARLCDPRAEARRCEPFRLGRGRAWAETLLWILLAMIAVLPLVALLAASLAPALGVPLRFGTATLANYRFALLEQDATLRAFAQQLPAGVHDGACQRRGCRAARLSRDVAAEPHRARARCGRRLCLMRCPGTVLAIAIILVFLPPLPLLDVSLYGTIGIILIAYLARFLALVLRPTMAGMELVNRNLDEAAQVAGAAAVAAAARRDPAVGRAVRGGRRVADLHERAQRAHGLRAVVVDRPRDARCGRVLLCNTRAIRRLQPQSRRSRSR